MMVIEFLPRVDAETDTAILPVSVRALDPASDGRFPNTDPDAGVPLGDLQSDCLRSAT
jgi:hypothetical protein